MSTDTIKIGIIGAGGIVKQRHLPGLRAIPGVEISLVCNRRRETAETVASQYGIPEVAGDWRDAVAHPGLDVIWIGAMPNLHAPVTIAALDAGKHVFCQARMARNLAEARAMLAAAQAHPGQVTMLCPPPNAMKHGRYFAALLKEGAIGRPAHFNLVSFNGAWADPAAPAHWRQNKELSGNNIMSVGIYAEVLGRWFGQPQTLCAQGQVVYPRRGDFTVEIPDAVQVLAEWPEKLQAVLQWSGISCDAPTDRLQVFGTEGTLSYDFLTDEILLARRGEKTASPLPVPAQYLSGWTVEADFIHAVRYGGQPEPSFQTGVNYMTVVEAVNESIRRHEWVALSSL